jgi:hypothetical protein
MPDYFTLDEFRELPSMDDTNKYPDADVERAADYITAVVERAVGTSFVGREFTKTLREPDADTLLGAPFVLSVSSVAIADAAVSNTFAIEGFYTTGLARLWPDTGRNVTVTYTAGYSTEPPADIKEAVMQATRARLLEKHGSARVQDRHQTISNDAGGTTTFVLAGPDNPTGYPEVDAVILGWRRRLFGFGLV